MEAYNTYAIPVTYFFLSQTKLLLVLFKTYILW